MDYNQLSGNTLFICEKFEVAEALTVALGKDKAFANTHKRNKFIPVNNAFLTWCDGHVLQLDEPKDYNQDYAKWKLQDLPLKLTPFRFNVSPSKALNFKTIKELIAKVNNVIHCGDADEEGQIIVDEVLEKISYKGKVYRYHMNDNNPKAILKALANLKENEQFSGITNSVKARIVADFRFGINLSRLYSLISDSNQLNIGRVRTPMAYMVYLREQEHFSHQSAFYYSITADFQIDGLTDPIKARYQKAEADPVDDKGRIIDEAFANTVITKVKGQKGTIDYCQTTQKETPPPLPFSMSTLQIYCARMLRIEPSKVMEVTQALRTKYSLITYNRSLSQYLNEDQFLEAPQILAAIKNNLPSYQDKITNCDTSFKSAAFDNSKVDPAHHGIIPTEATADFSKLDDIEKAIYEIIASRYIAQFYGNYVFDHTGISISCDNYQFTATSQTPVKQGWKSFLNDSDEEETEEKGSSQSLKDLTTSSKTLCIDATASKEKTKPKPLYTTATLLKQLSNAAEYIKDEQLRKVLKNKDKEIKGENGGIGTPATRDSIFKSLFEDNILKMEKNNVRTTEKAQALFKALPDSILYPDMTAYWWSQQLKIKDGSLTIDDFLQEIDQFIDNQVKTVNSSDLRKLFNTDYGLCPECQNPLRRVTGKSGVFFGCSNYQAGCKFSVPEKGGKPDFDYKPKELEFAEEKCPQCQGKLVKRAGKKGAFFGCVNFKTGCKFSAPEKNGKPDFDYTPTKSENSGFKCPDCNSDIVKRIGKKGHFWACSGYPKCTNLFGNKDKPVITLKLD